MSSRLAHNARMRWFLVAALVLEGCASHSRPAPPVPPQSTPASASLPPPAAAASKPRLPHYACDDGMAFDARFGDDDVQLLFASGETETLMRDAGGTSPQQTVYSSTRMKAEFGLEPDARGAKLNVAEPARSVRCMRE